MSALLYLAACIGCYLGLGLLTLGVSWCAHHRMEARAEAAYQRRIADLSAAQAAAQADWDKHVVSTPGLDAWAAVDRRGVPGWHPSGPVQDEAVWRESTARARAQSDIDLELVGMIDGIVDGVDPDLLAEWEARTGGQP